jgi:hypothetical protein
MGCGGFHAGPDGLREFRSAPDLASKFCSKSPRRPSIRRV